MVKKKTDKEKTNEEMEVTPQMIKIVATEDNVEFQMAINAPTKAQMYALVATLEKAKTILVNAMVTEDLKG